MCEYILTMALPLPTRKGTSILGTGRRYECRMCGFNVVGERTKAGAVGGESFKWSTGV